MIAKCESYLGLRGRPNEITRWYAQRNGSWFADAAWCNMFITYCAFHSGNYPAVNHGKDYAYTVYHAQRFVEAGEWHTDTAGIRRGDIVFFDWNGSNNISAIDHIGIVTKVVGADIHTVEGNTSDSCARRVRRADTIVGYGRPKYVNVTPKPEPKPEPQPQPKPEPKPEGDVYAKGLPKIGRNDPSAKPLQRQLKRVGYLAQGVTVSDNYGPQTQAAVKRFHGANPKFGTASDPQIGPKGWEHLKNEKDNSYKPPAAPKGIASPVPGYKVTYAYGIKNSRYAAGYHTGDDYAAPTGADVVAVRDGTIGVSNDRGGAYGSWIILRADNGRDYVYCHLSVRRVKAGDRVKAGQHIGDVGATGNVTGPHLHFEDRPRGGGYGNVREPRW
jgi:murein DD-endopeptidase MepM/ murein hydrolase activator NlpD